MEADERRQLQGRGDEMRVRLEQAYAELRVMVERMEGLEADAPEARMLGVVRQQLAAAEEALAALDAALERA